MTKPIYIINGPNLNLLGTREPEIYGALTLDQIREACEAHAGKSGRPVVFFQSNHEGQLIDWLHDANVNASAVVMNPGAYTHTSIALHDAVRAIEPPVIEVHLSQTAAREEFRHQSFIAAAATGSITGFGLASYLLGIDAAVQSLNT
ncbi:MAG: type II 3-dehydroquinate dehydratase [Maricaulis sp.]|jgi:3-dehydroquinate dehydratase-2|uniref:type II 3-dehydroquinate dehydratase n=1 Tax=Maricaulis sp. TaxID=1486257 RepID=UPI001B193365|nr:type II 3-dehydroquinate dehydratase [Maricaulis sp.]MBO6730894.1 type II 3-dehydroquinate dehydratase [Maricaulis sp.]MBO6847835.1 type II 3-dehydroquinate dehydratase [Maricaulis sp.]MBO6877458.1 type II 3-dehydroquinate dehydratase [Maricaulis sp.]MDM7983526.1 type II 3-dehydroquinate dehydratase [Maricaulis sp.]